MRIKNVGWIDSKYHSKEDKRGICVPKDKSASHARIVPAARKEFLEKGFEKASMRSIAQAAGITSAGLYRHFADKEAMFAALVEPLLDELQALYQAMEQRTMNCWNRERWMRCGTAARR